ncbi:MAG: M48 family metallopeptidase [Gammaproteobacteria bacterium]|nr:M48 family metallopeptidase [Gammaproteobacteria bacterium]
MSQMQIGSLSLQLNRKSIKNLHISVLPPDGCVRVSAPEHMTDTAIRTAVVSRIPWIRKQQKNFAGQARQSEREMVTGECHFFWGKSYRLNIIERVGKHKVKVAGNGKLDLYVSPGTTQSNKKLVLTEFYRSEIKARIDKMLPDWQERTGVEVAYCGVRKMKTRWGSCNIQEKRIWLNLDLAKKPIECLEYILLHELVHLLERHHNERFRAHLEKLMPNWREKRNLLNNMPLAHENWSY